MNQTTDLFDETSAEALLRLAQLPLAEERVEALVAAALPVHQLLKTIADIDMGETPPAVAFNAAWE
jgi:hypothetical protein